MYRAQTKSGGARKQSYESIPYISLPLFPGAFRPRHGSCAEVAEWQTALDLLAVLRAGQVKEGGEPLEADTVSFNATINALGRGGEWKKAVALLREMTRAGLGVKVRHSESRQVVAFGRSSSWHFPHVHCIPRPLV